MAERASGCGASVGMGRIGEVGRLSRWQTKNAKDGVRFHCRKPKFAGHSE